ncbi:MAG: AMP-binding protein, partial [Desulfarculaceae bacterium]|nr:AMP-binding protein [Desulfarculaceae bacterium]
GWLHTGDLGRFDAKGYLYVVDRLKDMIKTGGLNVYSREVEEVLLQHPLVRDVAVIGLPHPRWGEAVCAVVVPQPGARLDDGSIQAHCQQRLAGYKKPAMIRFVDTLPKTTFGGKVLKRELRKMFKDS